MLRDQLVVAMPIGHPLSRHREVSLLALAEYDFVISTRSNALSLHNKILQLCAAAGFVPTIVQEVSPIESIIGLVSAGVGIAIIPSMRQLPIAGVEYRSIRDRLAVIDFAMAWRKSEQSPVVKAFVNLAGTWKIGRHREAVRKQHAP
jgi:DNA-binding transcriptional LysR family regulator